MIQAMYTFYTSSVDTYSVQLRGDTRAPWSIIQLIDLSGVALEDFAQDRNLLGQTMVYILEDIAITMQPLHHPITDATSEFDQRKWYQLETIEYSWKI